MLTPKDTGFTDIHGDPIKTGDWFIFKGGFYRVNGTPEKPVGTVWFALSTKDKTSSSMSSFKGTRQTIRESSVKKILSLILGELEQNGR